MENIEISDKLSVLEVHHKLCKAFNQSICDALRGINFIDDLCDTEHDMNKMLHILWYVPE